MSSHPKLPTLILFAIILFGGFGIARMVLVRHDPIGISAIILALVLVGAFKRLSTSKHPYIGNAMGIPQSKWPIQLKSAACERFEIFPGRPEGYAGYTDHTAMSVDVNDDLATRAPADQYALLGFGNGFLQGIQNRLAEGDGHSRTSFRLANTSQKYRESIGWLAYLQRSGTDNAGPSTENLYSVIQSVSKAALLNGPITMKFWDKTHNKKNESLESSGTSTKMLEEWIIIYEEAFHQGQQQATVAIVAGA